MKLQIQLDRASKQQDNNSDRGKKKKKINPLSMKSWAVEKTEISQPYAGFNVYDIKKEVVVQLKGLENGPTIEILLELQHKHNIPPNTSVRFYIQDHVMPVVMYDEDMKDVAVMFRWDEPSNLPKKEKSNVHNMG